MDFVADLEQLMAKYSMSHWGVTHLERPFSLDLYRDWLDQGFHGEMDYLRRHLPQKEHPQSLAPEARAAIVVAKNYLPHPYRSDARHQLQARTALYAQGGDYHSHFRSELQQLAEELKVKNPSAEFLCFTDSSPILERDLAARAGLGWVGKNTCLIHPKKGSLFFLGEIFTSLDLQPNKQPIPDFCGTCDRCMKACPTQALVAPRVLDATRCIAYWTIEAKATAPLHLRESIGDWLFGCDICQTVCPWNEKVFGRESMQKLSPPIGAPTRALIDDLRWLLTSSHGEIERGLGTSPYLRARAKGLKRNAVYVVGNLRLQELRAEVEAVTGLETELVQWALARCS